MASTASTPTDWARRVALVTGASAGIGAEVCEHLVLRLGMRVIGCARNIQKIQVSIWYSVVSVPLILFVRGRFIILHRLNYVFKKDLVTHTIFIS